MCGCGSGTVEVYRKPQKTEVVKVSQVKVEEITAQSDNPLPTPKITEKKVSRKTRNYRQVLKNEPLNV